MMQTPAESESALQEAVDRIARRFHPDKIILFGSRRGQGVKPTLFTLGRLRGSGFERVKGGRCFSRFSHHPFALPAGGGCRRISLDRALQSGVAYDQQRESM
jgi:hypothetical protein